VRARHEQESGHDSGEVTSKVTIPESQYHATLDIEKALILLEGDRELFLEVLGVFVDSIPGMLADVQEAVAASDSQMLNGAAHSLRGAASSVCAEPVRRVAQQLEDMG